jgi:predicted Ser/Thr protein kinase
MHAAPVKQIGPYKVLGKLGEGGMGTVYRVQDPEAPRQLAVKLIKGDDAHRTERFLREAETLARVTHPAVVKVHHLERGPPPYLVLELIEGTPLADMPPPTPRQAAKLIRELADAVAAVHREGILHRDLKPENVIVRDGKPVLLDFGVARDQNADTLTKTGVWVGTLAYVAPEILTESSVNAAPGADVYALGVLLYELLMGHPPFEGGQVELIGQILNVEPDWPRSARDDVDPELEEILRHAMAKSPLERYASAEALRDDLSAYLAGRQTLATRARQARNRVASLRVGVGLGLLGAVAALAIVLRGGAAPAPQDSPVTQAPVTEAEANAPEPEDRLWDLDVGDRLTATLTIDERGGIVQYRFDTLLRGRVISSTPDRAVVRFEFKRLAAEIRLSSAESKPHPAAEDGPISRVLQRVQAPFECTIGRRTGAVLALTGLDAFRDQLADESEELHALEDTLYLPEQGKPDIVGSLQLLFTPQYLGTVLTCLLGVLDARVPMGWQRTGRSRQQERFFARQGRVTRPTHVDLDAEAVYAAGALQTSTITQASPEAGHKLTWSWTLEPPPE